MHKDTFSIIVIVLSMKIIYYKILGLRSYFVSLKNASGYCFSPSMG